MGALHTEAGIRIGVRVQGLGFEVWGLGFEMYHPQQQNPNGIANGMNSPTWVLGLEFGMKGFGVGVGDFGVGV